MEKHVTFNHYYMSSNLIALINCKNYICSNNTLLDENSFCPSIIPFMYRGYKNADMDLNGQFIIVAIELVI